MSKELNLENRIFFDRYSAAKNTFFVGNLFLPAMKQFDEQLDKKNKIELVKYLCGGIFDQKSDGVFFIKPNANLDFEWEFFNSDGSFAEMCGNAARCASLAFFKYKNQTEASFITGAGEISSQIILNKNLKIEDSITVFQSKVKMTQINEARELIVEGYSGLFLNTGVPHFVVDVSPDLNLGKILRMSKQFAPSGTNITFVKDRSDFIEAVTFERGVEGFTQACGTGAVAAAAWKNYFDKSSLVRRVLMPGGELVVENANVGSRPFLVGDVKMDYRMTDFGYERFLKGGS